MNHTTLHRMLSAWGRHAREIPPHNETLKSEVIAHVVIAPSSSMHQRMPNPFPWASLALAGLGLFALLGMPARIDKPVFFPESIGGREPGISILEKKKESIKMPQARDTGSAQYNTMESAPSLGTRSGGSGGFEAQQEIPIADPREYLKTDYQAAIYTRNVQELTQRVQTAVRGFGGRVDGLNSSPTYGSIHFVIPASQFNAFQNEVINLAGKRFLIENIYTENLLPQKQSIEQDSESARKTLIQLNVDRAQLIENHNRVLTAIHAQLAAYVYELSQLKREVTIDPVRQAQIAARIQWLLKEEKIINARLENENADYGRNFQLLDIKIMNAKNNIEFLRAQNQQLLNTVATIRGTISFHWISWRQIVNLYIPFPWIPILLMGGAVITYGINRRKNRLIVF